MRKATTTLAWVKSAALALAIGCSGSDGDGDASDNGGAGGRDGTGGTPSTGGRPNGGAGGGAAGTGGEDGGAEESEFGPYIASCDYRESSSSLAGRCRDWYGGPNPPNLASSCNDIYMREPCPSEDRVGRCQLDPVVRVVAVYNYYAPTWTAETARDNCGGRTWIPEPGLTDGGAEDGGALEDAGLDAGATDASSASADGG